jgi:hypothetical protein
MDGARDREEAELFAIIQGTGGAHDGGADDGSQYLNPSGEGMEPEPTDEAQTSANEPTDEAQTSSQNVGTLTKSDEVY